MQLKEKYSSESRIQSSTSTFSVSKSDENGTWGRAPRVPAVIIVITSTYQNAVEYAARKSPISACPVAQDSKNSKTFSTIFTETGLKLPHRPPLQPLATDLDALAKRTHSKFTSGPSPRPRPGTNQKLIHLPRSRKKRALKVQPNARSLCLFSSSVSESVRDRAINGVYQTVRMTPTPPPPPPPPPSAAAVAAGGSSCGGGRTKATLRA